MTRLLRSTAQRASGARANLLSHVGPQLYPGQEHVNAFRLSPTDDAAESKLERSACETSDTR